MSHRDGRSRLSSRIDSRGWPACSSTSISSEFASASCVAATPELPRLWPHPWPLPERSAARRVVRRRAPGPCAGGLMTVDHPPPRYTGVTVASWPFAFMLASSFFLLPLLPMLSCSQSRVASRPSLAPTLTTGRYCTFQDVLRYSRLLHSPSATAALS